MRTTAITLGALAAGTAATFGGHQGLPSFSLGVPAVNLPQPTPAPHPAKWTTSVICATSVQTITSCPPVWTVCPPQSTVVTTVTIPVSTTVCPVTETETFTEVLPPPLPTSVALPPAPPPPPPSPPPPAPSSTRPVVPQPPPPLPTTKTTSVQPPVITGAAGHNAQGMGRALVALAVVAVLL